MTDSVPSSAQEEGSSTAYARAAPQGMRERQHPVIHRTRDGSVLLFNERKAVCMAVVPLTLYQVCWRLMLGVCSRSERIRMGRYGWNEECKLLWWLR